VPALFGTLIVACHSPSSQPSDNLNELLPLPETMLELVALRGLPSSHLGKELHRAKRVGKFNLPALRVIGLRQSVIGGYF
jgi:hypothetical protein